jgi:hypothetical protein
MSKADLMNVKGADSIPPAAAMWGFSTLTSSLPASPSVSQPDRRRGRGTAFPATRVPAGRS